jgi:hypothetical protein
MPRPSKSENIRILAGASAPAFFALDDTIKRSELTDFEAAMVHWRHRIGSPGSNEIFDKK